MKSPRTMAATYKQSYIDNLQLLKNLVTVKATKPEKDLGIKLKADSKISYSDEEKSQTTEVIQELNEKQEKSKLNTLLTITLKLSKALGQILLLMIQN